MTLSCTKLRLTLHFKSASRRQESQKASVLDLCINTCSTIPEHALCVCVTVTERHHILIKPQRSI